MSGGNTLTAEAEWYDRFGRGLLDMIHEEQRGLCRDAFDRKLFLSFLDRELRSA